MTRGLLRLVALTLFVGCQPPRATGPRLGVLVVFDQLRAAELDRYAAFFEGGFGGLEGRGGARYDARYRYADTETAPGHATLVTGANPRVHGIVSNYWFDETGRRIYAIDDPTAPVLGTKKARGASAHLLAAQTLGDVLKLESNGRARVVTMSLKDRSAILTGGRAADVALWYDVDQCAFTTSRAYADALPAWAAGLAAELPARSMKDGVWSPREVPHGLDAFVARDESPNEAGELAWTDRFPHDLRALSVAREKCVQYRASPQAIDDLMRLADAAVRDEALALGKDAVPDFLVVSVSTTDYVGHGWGPQSLEMLDILRHADQALRGLVRTLDRRYGSGGYVIAVSSDHGSAPLVELGAGLGLDAGRIDVAGLRARIEETVEQTVERLAPKAARPATTVTATTVTGKSAPGPHLIAKDAKESASSAPHFVWLKGLAPPHVYLDLAPFSGAIRAEILEATRRAIATFPGISDAYVVDGGRVVGNDGFVPLYQELVFADRHGAIMVRPKARWVYAFDGETVGTDHGTPYLYDATVPFIVSGPGVRAGRYAQPCDARDVAPTMAFLLRTPAPDHAEGRPVSAVGADVQPR